MVFRSGATVKRKTETIFPPRLFVCLTVLEPSSLSNNHRMRRVVLDRIKLAVKFGVESLSKWSFGTEPLWRTSIRNN
jgi:hypothetical protein